MCVHIRERVTYTHSCTNFVACVLTCVQFAHVNFSITSNCLLILILSSAIQNFQLFYAILHFIVDAVAVAFALKTSIAAALKAGQ